MEEELKKYKRKNILMTIIAIILLPIIIYMCYFIIRIMIEIIEIEFYDHNYDSKTYYDPTKMSEEEIDAFNAEWISYEGTQSGTQVKSLLSRLIANANTYKEEQNKIPNIELIGETDTENIIYNEILEEYIQKLQEIGSIESNIIKRKHFYTISLEYSAETSLVNKIIIEY